MRALIVSTERPNGIAFELIKSFQNHNFQIEMIHSPMVCTKWNLFIRLKRRFGMNIESYLDKKSNRFEKRVIKKCMKFRPDVVCDLGAFLLNESVIENIKEQCLIVTILLDRLCFFPRLFKTVGFYDLVYTYSKEDNDFLCAKGIRCKFNHAMGERYSFFPIHMKKTVDVFFVGSMYPEKDYGYRYELLKKLIYDLPNVHFVVGGICAPLRRPRKFFEWFSQKPYRRSFLNKTLSKAECNVLYNKSKICLNLERVNTGNTWSGRLANILRTGSFVITKRNDELDKKFGNDIETFTNYDELKSSIIYYLSNEEERSRLEAREYARFCDLCKEVDFDKVADIKSNIQQYNRNRKNWDLNS